MDRRNFLGSLGAIALATSIKLLDIPLKEKQWAAILFRNFVFWNDEKKNPIFCRLTTDHRVLPSKDQTIHGWLVTAMPKNTLAYHYVYKIRLVNCNNQRVESIPMRVYKHRVTSHENFQDYLCEFTADWIMGNKTYRKYLPNIKKWKDYGLYFQTGAIC